MLSRDKPCSWPAATQSEASLALLQVIMNTSSPDEVRNANESTYSWPSANQLIIVRQPSQEERFTYSEPSLILFDPLQPQEQKNA